VSKSDLHRFPSEAEDASIGGAKGIGVSSEHTPLLSEDCSGELEKFRLATCKATGWLGPQIGPKAFGFGLKKSPWLKPP
jgi:hypothetical protein